MKTLTKTATKTIIAAGLCLGLTAACQTTKTWDSKPQEVSVSETKFDMDLTSFKIKNAKKWSQASSYGESVDFLGGYVYRYVYQRGYVINPNETDVHKGIANIYKDNANPEAYKIKQAKLPLGNILYATTYNTKQTCFFFRGHAGDEVMSRGKRASSESIHGLLCEPGHVADMEKVALAEFGKVTLRR